MISHSLHQTKHIAADLAQRLSGGEVLCLQGELGAGKTSFVQGLAKALGVEGPVRSPTFTIMNVYDTCHPSIKQLIHLDFYRLKSEEAHELGLEEWLGRSDVVAAVEWPPEDLQTTGQKIHIFFDVKSSDEREILIDPASS